MTKRRELEGIKIAAEEGNIRELDRAEFLVRSQTNPQNVWYRVKWQRKRWVCDCPDFAKRLKRCKHIYAVRYHIMLRELRSGIGSASDERKCPSCGQTKFVTKRGIRYNQGGVVQRYYCKKCGKRFSGRTAFGRMKTKATAIVTALDLYYRGLSLRQISEHLDAVHGVKITHGTVYYWIRKYVELVSRYVENLRPKTSERWHADEMLLQVQGRHLVLWTLLDSETRLLIASHLSQNRDKDEARALIEGGLEKSRSEPLEFVTDGLSSYGIALKEILRGRKVKHGLVHLHGPLIEALNNKIERLHKTVKTRTGTMGKLNSNESAHTFVKGFQTYYNFVREHKALGGRTPAQAAGLTRRKLTWLDLISAAASETQTPSKES